MKISSQKHWYSAHLIVDKQRLVAVVYLCFRIHTTRLAICHYNVYYIIVYYIIAVIYYTMRLSIIARAMFLLCSLCAVTLEAV